MSPPDLPQPPPETETESMLSRKFGPEVLNYYAGSILNRVSFLRTDHVFLDAALRHKSTKFLLFRDLAPLTENPKTPRYVKWADVGKIIDLNGGPYRRPEEKNIQEYDSRIWQPPLLFLGLDRRTEKETDTFAYKDKYKGTPYFALDISTPPAFIDTSSTSGFVAATKELTKQLEEQKLEFVANRLNLQFHPEDAAIYIGARHVIDWTVRNPFCAQCGNRTLLANAGWKKICAPIDKASGIERPPCATRKGISNICFPRTDPVIIVAIVSADGQKMLLGRSKRFPPGMYSTLAGFLEPGEALEEAVRREVWEEAGTIVSRVVIHSSQPWMPSSIMIGAIAQAVPGEDEREPDLDNDAELESAKWFTLDEIRKGLGDTDWAEKGMVLKDPTGDEPKEDIPLRLPPRTAIAHTIMAAVANGGFLTGQPKI